MAAAHVARIATPPSCSLDTMLRTSIRRSLVWLLITWLPAASVRAENLIFQIGLSTTQQRIFDSSNPITYNFGVTQAGGAANLQGVQFAFFVDRQQNATQPVIFNLYNGLGGASGTNATTGTNQSLGITTVSATNYPLAGGNNVFSSLTAPILLPPGEYSVQLTTAASGNNQTYRWKPGPLQLTSTSGANLSNFLYIEDNNQLGSAGNTLNAANPVLAQPLLSVNSVSFGNFRPGVSLSQTATLTNNNLPTANNMSQALASGTTTIAGGASISGVPTTASPLNQGFIANLPLGLASGSAGPTSGQVVMNYLSVQGSSTATGTTAIGSGTIALTGTGYNWANAAYSGTTLALGFVHRGAAAVSGSVAIGNQAVADASFQDALDVTGSTGNALVSATGFSGLAATASGTGRGNLVVTAATGTAGSLASTVALSLVSNANGVAGLANGTATTVGSPGAIATTGTVYTGQSVWATNGSGQWGTLASNFGTNWNWATFDGSPGVDAGFADTDTATFGGAVTSGTATVTIAAATPSVRSVTFSNAAATYVVTGSSGGSLALLNAGTNAATVSVTAGSHSLATGIALGSRATMDVAAGSRLTVSGAISGTNGILKTGTGVLSITGINSYTGATTVASGTLSVNGSIASSSLTTVQAGATLAGSGSVGDTVVYGSHTPGNSPGIQTTDNLTYETGASLTWELIANSISGRGTNYDGVDVNGALTFAGSTSLFLSFSGTDSGVDWSNAFWETSRTGTNGWLVHSGADSLSGFANLAISGTNWADGQGDMLGTVRQGASFSTYQSGNDVYLNYVVAAVPEPDTFALAGLGLGLAAYAARRRRAREA